MTAVQQRPWRRVARGMVWALVRWGGEAAVGLVPLLTHVVVKTHSKHISDSAICESRPDGEIANCVRVIEDLPYAEMNILAVVISGLGILTLFGPYGRKMKFTPVTYMAAIAALGLLIVGSLLYALETAHIGQGAEELTRYVLGLAVLVSFYLALEEAWLEALHEGVPLGDKPVVENHRQET